VSHNLLKDGSVVVAGYASGALYNPGDTNSHTYVGPRRQRRLFHGLRGVGVQRRQQHPRRAADHKHHGQQPLCPGWDQGELHRRVGLPEPRSLQGWYKSGDGLQLRRPLQSRRHGRPYYVVRALNGNCHTDSAGSAFTDANLTPGVPTIGTVTVTGPNQLRITWTAGSPAGATYNIYRADGSCPGGAYALIKNGLAGSPWTDTTVVGGNSYSYKVTAVDGTGTCESPASGCAWGTACGPTAAVYNATYKAPACTVVGTSCDTGSSMIHCEGASEPNYPNTVNSFLSRRRGPAPAAKANRWSRSPSPATTTCVWRRVRRLR